MTPSDVEQALSLGCKLLKFFPAETAGGVPMLKALAGLDKAKAPDQELEALDELDKQAELLLNGATKYRNAAVAPVIGAALQVAPYMGTLAVIVLLVAVPVVLGGGHETTFGHFLGYVYAGIEPRSWKELRFTRRSLSPRPIPMIGHGPRPRDARTPAGGAGWAGDRPDQSFLMGRLLESRSRRAHTLFETLHLMFLPTPIHQK